MRRIFLGGALLATVCAICVAPALALTLPEVLAHGKSWTGKAVAGTTVVLERLNGKNFTCSGMTADGNEEAVAGHSLGEFHLHFTGCKSGIANRNSSGDAAEVILVLGKWHLVHDTLVELGVALLYLFEALYTCGGIITIHVRGSVECLVLEPTSSKLRTCSTVCSRKAIPLRRNGGTTAASNRTQNSNATKAVARSKPALGYC